MSSHPLRTWLVRNQAWLNSPIFIPVIVWEDGLVSNFHRRSFRAECPYLLPIVPASCVAGSFSVHWHYQSVCPHLRDTRLPKVLWFFASAATSSVSNPKPSGFKNLTWTTHHAHLTQQNGWGPQKCQKWVMTAFRLFENVTLPVFRKKSQSIGHSRIPGLSKSQLQYSHHVFMYLLWACLLWILWGALSKLCSWRYKPFLVSFHLLLGFEASPVFLIH